jgi:hypothetical protein
MLGLDIGANVWKKPWPLPAALPLVICRSDGVDPEVLPSSVDESSDHMIGAVFDLPCFVNWLGSCTTKAQAFPYE